MTDLAGKPFAELPGSRTAQPSVSAQSGQIARNVRLQYLRGFAATIVMLMHASDCLNQFRGDGRFIMLFKPFFGVFGVAIFFALSGALMAQLIKQGSPFRFILDRIVRIYPAMLFAVALAAIAFLLTGFGRRPELLTLTLIPIGPREYYFGNVEWTLLFEMTYYVALALLALAGLRRFAEVGALVWLIVLIALELSGRMPGFIQNPTITQLPLQAANVAFLIGFLLPRLVASRHAPPAWLLLLAGGALAIGSFFLSHNEERWLTSIAAALLVAAALRAPAGSSDGFAGSLAVRFGDASYVLYLVHIPVIVVSANILPPGIPSTFVWCGWVTGSLALAALLGPLDIAVHARLKSSLRRLPERWITLLAGGFLVVFAGVALWADVTTRIHDQAAERARTALSNPPSTAVPRSVLADVESADRLPDGRLVVRGHVIDLDAPAGDAHVAVLQRGQIVGFDRMRRMRPLIARAAARPDLAKIRFGFSVSTFSGFDCAAGPVEVRAILRDGRSLALPTELVETACRPQ